MKKILLVTMLAGSVYAGSTIGNHNTKIVNEKDLRYAYSSSNQECLKIDSKLRKILLDKDERYTVVEVKKISDIENTGKFYQFIVRTSLETLPFSVFSKKGGCLLYKDISLGTFKKTDVFSNPRYTQD